MTKEDIEKIRQIAQKNSRQTKSTPVRTREQILEDVQKADALKESKKFVRKTPTKLEKDLAELNEMLGKQISVPHVEKQIEEEKSEWDVKIGDPIDYFDPTLSYELTGYRPITATEGLDFDPKEFTKAADAYRAHGRYTNYTPGTFIHRKHWEEEFRRCREGYTVGKYTLTGENYFFLNYYRLLSVLSGKEGQETRFEDFPAFIAKQYEYFHYLELVRKLKKDGCAFKARGVKYCAPLR